MTDPRLSRLIAQHEHSPCKTCGAHADVRWPCHAMSENTPAHPYVPSFDVAEYITGIQDSWADAEQDQQGPLI